MGTECPEMRSCRDARPARDRCACDGFGRGDENIQQIPPAYSAIKINGERAYALARKGETPELSARPIRMNDLRLVEQPDPDTAIFEMTCGKGGYVRAIGRDLGQSSLTHGLSPSRQGWTASRPSP